MGLILATECCGQCYRANFIKGRTEDTLIVQHTCQKKNGMRCKLYRKEILKTRRLVEYTYLRV
mgnify:CR=1 FL=1